MTDKLKGTDFDPITSQIRNLALSWLVILSFIFASLLSRQVSLIDSLFLCLFLTVDVTSGAIFWTLLSKKRNLSVFEIFGTGIVLGTLICTIFQQLLRDTPLNEISPFLFLSQRRLSIIENVKMDGNTQLLILYLLSRYF